ncbi:DUF1080 domain-containing protein [Litorivivens sp.]|uniref:3-keto-disaccharide hydrolase n=1 Tax=Litorivivens sp. TaxID=2020868 RepID=UPI00356B2751
MKLISLAGLAPAPLTRCGGQACWRITLRLLQWLVLALYAMPVLSANTLTEDEAAQGWQLLFDGTTFDGWRNYGAAPGDPVNGWEIEQGTLKMVRDVSEFRYALNFINPFQKHPLLDLMTERQFENFELSIDWKISAGGNSGIFYLLPHDNHDLPWRLGLEMQVLDNDGHADGKTHTHRAGDLYDLVASNEDASRPVGEWNTARIRVVGSHIQHWLNGVKVVDIHRCGETWDELVAQSKFAKRAGYGQAERGHILLQDHGDYVWYRNIKLRPLQKSPTEHCPKGGKSQ